MKKIPLIKIEKSKDVWSRDNTIKTFHGALQRRKQSDDISNGLELTSDEQAERVNLFLLGFASIVLMNAMAVLIIAFVKVSEYEKQLVTKSNIIKRQIKGRYVIGNYSYSIVQNKHRRYIHIILDFFKPCMSLFKSLRLLNLEFFP